MTFSILMQPHVKTSYAEHFDTLRQAIHLLSDMLYQSSDKKVNVCDGYVN